MWVGGWVDGKRLIMYWVGGWVGGWEGRTRKFHLSGVVEGLTLSYPMEMRVPSLRRVMSMSMSTGMWKKAGQVCWREVGGWVGGWVSL